MKFSHFINNTINNDNSINWNYYGQSFNASQLLTNDNSKKFIQEYFKNGNKELALFLEPTAARNFITNYFDNGRKGWVGRPLNKLESKIYNKYKKIDKKVFLSEIKEILNIYTQINRSYRNLHRCDNAIYGFSAYDSAVTSMLHG